MGSLRARLIVGMLLGISALLATAGTTIYAMQRRQLYGAFDQSLLSSATALVSLVHPGPFGMWFDSEGLDRLPPDRIRQGALFEFWCDSPIHLPPSLPGREPEGGASASDDNRPPPPDRRGPEHPLRPPPPRFELPTTWPADAPVVHGEDVRVLRSQTLGGAALPQLATVPGAPRFESLVLPDGNHGRAVALAIVVEAPEFGFHAPPVNLAAVVAASTTELEQHLRYLAGLLAATALGTLLVSGAVAWLVVSRGLHPLARLAREIAGMDELALKRRIADPRAPREIEPVLQQLNGLLARLDDAFERERALTADVAHELRTPVAELRAIAEITLKRVRNPQEYQAALAESLEVVRALQGLIERILTLARLEAGQMQLAREEVRLEPVLVQHGAQLEAAAAGRELTVTQHCPTDLEIYADPKLLDMVLSNVLANAAAHVPDRGHVSVEARREETRCRLQISNDGCILEPGQMAHVFERFWRGDPARSRNSLNCGLGLTLVRRAMEAMGGQAVAEVNAEHQFTLTLTFDAAAAQVGGPAPEVPPDDPAGTT